MIPSPPIPAAVPWRTAERTGVIGSDRIERFLRSPASMTSIVLLGVALRVWAYAPNTSLYLDEILLTRNILDLPVSHLLTQPLLLDQVSPRGFLLVERLAVMIFGQGELALRLFPFVCAIVSVILFRRLAERVLTGAGPALSLLLFAIGVPCIRFGADVKPYEVDVAAAIGLLLLDARYARTRGPDKTFTAIRYRRFRDCVVLTGVRADDGWTGLRPCLGLVDLALISRDRRATRPLAITIPLWAAGCVVALLVGLRGMTPATRQFMHDFWSGGFLPLPLRLPAAFRWLWDRWTSLFSDPTLLRYSWPEIFVVVALVGVVALWSRRRPVALLLLGPFVVCMAAAIAHQYPFRGRLVVWLLPSLLLAVAAGTEWMRRQVSRHLIPEAPLVSRHGNNHQPRLDAPARPKSIWNLNLD